MSTSADPDLAVLVAGARSGSRRALGRLFSEAERAGGDADRAAALVAALTRPGAAPPAPGRVVGFTGAPGAGKSSLAAAVSAVLVGRGRRVAVLAVDPSSPISGGAVLGDRVRFADAAFDTPNAAAGEGTAPLLVRSLASRGHAGGLARAVPLAIAVAGGVGFDDVLVETVGSGQGEIAVAAAVDTTVLVTAPGQGDEVQAMKAGIAELADIICITKADLPGAAESARQWQAALAPASITAIATATAPAPATAGQWNRRVVLASARTADVAGLVAALDARAAWLTAAGAGRSAAASGSGGGGRASGPGDSAAAWHAATAAAATGEPAATIALMGAALLATARDRVGAAVVDAGPLAGAELIARAGLGRAITAADLDPGRLATVDGLVALVVTVRGRVGP